MLEYGTLRVCVTQRVNFRWLLFTGLYRVPRCSELPQLAVVHVHLVYKRRGRDGLNITSGIGQLVKMNIFEDGQ